jgi:hypothetical protein
MATRRYSIGPQGNLESVVIAAGAATVTAAIEITIDQAATLVTDGNSPTGTRPVKVHDILVAMEILEQAILRDTGEAWS